MGRAQDVNEGGLTELVGINEEVNTGDYSYTGDIHRNTSPCVLGFIRLGNKSSRRYLRRTIKNRSKT